MSGHEIESEAGFSIYTIIYIYFYEHFRVPHLEMTPMCFTMATKQRYSMLQSSPIALWSYATRNE